MLLCKYVWIILALFCITGLAAPLSDSLLIEGHYSQSGHSVSRRELEKFLCTQDVSMSLANRSKTWRWSAWGIGAGLWCVNTAISVYQVKLFIDALERKEPVNSSFDNVAVPLYIGGGVATFVQGRISTNSDYLLHKAVTAYNNDVCKRLAFGVTMDHRIVKRKSDWYLQDRVLMTEDVLYPVLKERYASRFYANSSIVCGELGSLGISAGLTFLALMAIGYIQEDNVDTGERKFHMQMGIGFTSFGIINKIISTGMRNSAIRRYNESLPKPAKQTQDQPALKP